MTPPMTCMILNRQDCFRAASRGRCERAGGQDSGAFLRAGRKGNDADSAINGVLSRMVRIWRWDCLPLPGERSIWIFVCGKAWLNFHFYHDILVVTVVPDQ